MIEFSGLGVGFALLRAGEMSGESLPEGACGSHCPKCRPGRARRSFKTGARTLAMVVHVCFAPSVDVGGVHDETRMWTFMMPPTGSACLSRGCKALAGI
jgi:hypothetical protein